MGAHRKKMKGKKPLFCERSFLQKKIFRRSYQWMYTGNKKIVTLIFKINI